MASKKIAEMARDAKIAETKSKLEIRNGVSGYVHRTITGREYFFPQVAECADIVPGRCYFIVATDLVRSGFIVAGMDKTKHLFETDIPCFTVYGPVPGSLHNGIPTPDEVAT